jgi:oxygen-independent coproporphyrinogen III oxidase
MAALSAAPVTSLYVHVPFCARKCAYCAFYSETADRETIHRYVAALIRELELAAAAGDLRPQTAFFGGGTPSLLPLQEWDSIFDALDRLGLQGAPECTVECNPATLSLDQARLLRSRGVNRVSMGVQSLDDTLLDRLGRIHTRAMAFKSFDILRQAGFDNINIDLMFAIPGQTLEMWRQTLVEAVAMESEHLSSYEVIYEEDTPLYEQLAAGKFDVPEDLACAMYEEMVERAEAAGLRQYEVANFARNRRAAAPQGQSPASGELESALNLPARVCLHNVNYWRGGSFYGCGPSATSYVRGVRWENWANTRLYCDQLERGERPIESSEELSPLGRAGETAAFGLRMVAGWPFDQFQQVTGHDLRQGWADEMAQLVKQGWGRITPVGFQLTPQGLRFADAAAQLFLR